MISGSLNLRYNIIKLETENGVVSHAYRQQLDVISGRRE